MADENQLAAEAAEAEDAQASEAEASETDETGEADEADQAETANAAETEGEDGDKAEGAEDAEDDKPKRKPRRSARERIAELTRQKREAESRARQLEKELAEKKPPRPEDFDDDAAYEEARDEYRFRRMRAREDRETAQTASRQIEQETAQDFLSHVETFKREAPDFEEVAYKAPISDDLAGAIARMGEDGPRVAYALGKDHDLARELSDLDPYSAAIELGRLAATPRRPQRKVASKAPPPVKPATEGGGPTTPDPEKMSYDDYRRWRMGS